MSRRGSPNSSSPASSPTVSLECPPGLSYLEFVKQWTDLHVSKWLSDSKVPQHAGRFREHDIRGDVILDLDQSALKETGVVSVGDRIKILVAVKALRQKCARHSSSSVRPRAPVASPLHLRIPNDGVTGNVDPSPSRTQSRRLDAGRPPPLNIAETVSRDLPQLVATASNTTPRHPGPFGSNPVQFPSPTPSARPPPPPPTFPAPKAQLPPPPRASSRNGPPNSSLATPSQAYLQGRKTPEPQPPPAFTKDPLPPAPNTASSSSGWQNGGYGLPARPTPGNLQAGTFAADKASVPFPRAGSPAGQPSLRGAAARVLHQKSGSTSQTTRGTGPTVNVAQRPGTSGDSSSMSPIAHPYGLRDQPAANGLQVPGTGLGAGFILSPITETGSNSGADPTTPSASSTGYSVGRGPFKPNPVHLAPMSLEELKRLCVKFILADDGHSRVVNVGDCEGGVEVIERVLRKMGKIQSGPLFASETETGGLVVGGWAIYLDGPGRESVPLAETELLAICHADPSNPSREAGLTLRRYQSPKKVASKLENFFGERPPIESSSSTSNAPKLSLAIPGTDGQGRNTPSVPVTPTPGGVTGITSPVRTAEQKRMARASTVSVMSGLGLLPPGVGEPPSPTQDLAVLSRSPQKKLRKFFGHRPPSELITSHLPEFFPNTEKKVLERTARHSVYMNRDSIARASWLSAANEPLPYEASPRASFESSPQSRKASRRRTQRPPTIRQESYEVPRVSISTEEGQSVDFSSEMDEDEVLVPKEPATPHVLPPVAFLDESFSDSLLPQLGGSAAASRSSTLLSRASRRNSVYTEVKGRTAASESTTLLTLDEIAAEVESRRTTMLGENKTGDDTLDADEPLGSTTLKNEEEELASDNDNDETILEDESPEEDEEDDGELVAVPEDVIEEEDVTPEDVVPEKVEIKWSKGALIGAGSFGSVYLGLDMSRGLLMAVKQVELPTGSSVNEERKKNMLSALEREIALLKELQHPNIVQYLDSAMDETHLNIFLEYVPGGSLVTVLRAFGAFAEGLTRNWVKQILQGLVYLHEKNIVHRDIKGANILIDNKGSAKISDFGISKRSEGGGLMSSARAHRPSLQGSVFWMAPEVVKQSAHTVKADIWSLGCLVVEMLTGEHPWANLSQMQAIFKIGSSARPELPPDISKEAEDFLQKTFELDHTKRPSAVELLEHPWIVIQE